MKKKCYLYAYDKVNLGDDLFIRVLADRYPNTKFYFWTDNANREVFHNNKNISILNEQTSYIKILQKIRPSLILRVQDYLKKKSDAVVYVGGSIFAEYPNWQNIVNWWKYQGNHYKFYVLGANFGPYHTDEFRKGIGEAYNNLQDVCFRDDYSYQLFKSCPKVRKAPDILFGYPMPKIKKTKKQIYISVINCSKKDPNNENLKACAGVYKKLMLDIIDYYSDLSFKIKLVSFCKHEGDEEFADELYELRPDKKIDKLYYNGYNTEEVLQELVDSEYVIATRFHATILALVAYKKILPIIYSEKTSNVLKDIGFFGELLEITEYSNSSLNLIKDKLENLSYNKLENIESTILHSNQHFAFLDKELE